MQGLDTFINHHLNFQKNNLWDATRFGLKIKPKLSITPKLTNFLSRQNKILKQAKRGLIKFLSEELNNVVHSTETELKSFMLIFWQI